MRFRKQNNEPMASIPDPFMPDKTQSDFDRPTPQMQLATGVMTDQRSLVRVD